MMALHSLSRGNDNCKASVTETLAVPVGLPGSLSVAIIVNAGARQEQTLQCRSFSEALERSAKECTVHPITC
jgi:UDP-N-acetylenolpyruvoylglucosamine reductase